MSALLKFFTVTVLLMTLQIQGSNNIITGLEEYHNKFGLKPSLSSIRNYLQQKVYDEKDFDNICQAFPPSSSKYYQEVLLGLSNTEEELFSLALDLGSIYRYVGNQEDALEITYFAFKNKWHIHDDDLIRDMIYQGILRLPKVLIH